MASASRPTLAISESADTVTCRGADGKTVALHKRPRRAIINYTSLVGLWYRAGGVAVGMPDTKSRADLPDAARGIATTGHTAAPNIERILSLDPTLVILAANMEKQRALKDILDGAGIETLLLSYETYADYISILDLFYRLNGGNFSADTGARAVVDKVDAICALTRGRPAPRFLSIFASTFDAQAETDLAHTAFMATYLGARNIVEKTTVTASFSRIPLSLERIHMEDPDVIFVTAMGDLGEIRAKMRKDFMESDAWKSLRAVKDGRVHFLPNDLFLLKPNDRFPEAFEALAAFLYPGVK